MNKTKSFLIGLLAAGAMGLAACGESTPTEPVGDDAQIREIYNLYVESMEAQGEKPKSYEEWLSSIKGEKGDKGDKGDTGEKGDKGDTGATAWSNTILPVENGRVVPMAGSALAGQPMTFVFLPNPGYFLDEVTLFSNGTPETKTELVNYETNSLTVDMVEGGYTVYAQFKQGVAIRSLQQLSDYRDAVNLGNTPVGTAKLVSDIDLGNEAWRPIGTKANPFCGTFDGDGHTISGLTNDGYIVLENDTFTTDYASNTGAPYGFFGVVGAASSETTEIKDVNLTDVDIDMNNANIIGGLVAADVKGAKSTSSNYGGRIVISDVSVEGSIVSTNPTGVTIGGVAGKIYNNGGRVDLANCVNYADIEATNNGSGDIKGAGVLGFVSNETSTYTLDHCKNYGDLTLINSGEVYAAGVVVKSWGDLYVKECSTQGEHSITGSTVWYSAIGRLQNHDTLLTEDVVEFENVSYQVYRDGSEPTNIKANGNAISEETGYHAFVAEIHSTSSSVEQTIQASTEGFDWFKLYGVVYP